MSYVQSDENSSFEVTTIATTTGPLSEVYFPSVIVCSINQIRKSLFRVGSQKQQNFGHLRVWKHFSNNMHVNSGPRPTQLKDLELLIKLPVFFVVMKNMLTKLHEPSTICVKAWTCQKHDLCPGSGGGEGRGYPTALGNVLFWKKAGLECRGGCRVNVNVITK